MRFCKDLLGVQKQTTNIGVLLLELGRVPIMLYGKKNFIKNWGMINIQGSANKMLLLPTTENELMNWNLSVKNCLDLMGIGGGTNMGIGVGTNMGIGVGINGNRSGY